MKVGERVQGKAPDFHQGLARLGGCLGGFCVEVGSSEEWATGDTFSDDLAGANEFHYEEVHFGFTEFIDFRQGLD